VAVSNDRAAALIRQLGMQPHPEGGHFAETYRSDSRVTPAGGRAERRALTTIYYLLAAGETSAWHCVQSDEVWHFCEGAPLELFVLRSDTMAGTTHQLGALSGDREPVIAVRAGDWQAARSTGPFTLVACSVAPGFEYQDFTMARDVPAVAAAIRQRHPDLATFL
jgi:predicted cupin superfamily sugar epimerase